MRVPLWLQTRVLGRSGGSTVAESARHIMKRLMSNEVAVLCNWKGKSGKYGLNKTFMEKIVCGKLNR